MRVYLLALLFFSSNYLSSQEFIWQAKVLDHNSGSPLIGVNIFDTQLALGTSTDSDGKLDLEINTWPVSFEVSYLGYESKIINADRPEDMPTVIRLRQDATRMDEVVISDKAIPRKMTSKWRSVTDFILFKDRVLYVETEGNQGSSIIYLATNEGEVLDKLPTKKINLFEELFLSCQETPYLIGEYSAYELDLSADQIILQFESKIDDFDTFVRPCKASNERFLYHGKRMFKDQLARITQIDKENLERKVLTQVFDSEQLQATKQSIDLIKLYDHFAKHTKKAFYKNMIARESGHLKIFSQPVDYDVFTVGDQVLVMDHENSVISYFNQEALHQKDVNIYYNQQKNWSGIVRQDHNTEKIYVVIKDGNSLILHHLDVDSGKLNFIAFLDVDMIDKIDIQDNTLWYTASKMSGPEIGKRLHKLDL